MYSDNFKGHNWNSSFMNIQLLMLFNWIQYKTYENMVNNQETWSYHGAVILIQSKQALDA